MLQSNAASAVLSGIYLTHLDEPLLEYVERCKSARFLERI
jgi:hypothetical protein